jgi:SAM-dependent methyltransferase
LAIVMRDHPLFAAVYDRLTMPAEAAGLAERRRRLLSAARGRVLEVGAGTGHNLPHYPPGDVDSVTLIEPDGAMRRHLAEHLSSCAVPVEVIPDTIEDARLDQGSFDAVVCTLVLCTVPDLDAAMARIRSLLRPTGQLLFLEHVRAPGGRGRVQRAVTPLWKRAVPGCHLDRDPIAAMRRAGFLVTDCERFQLPLGNTLVGAAVQGAARTDRRTAA